MLSSDCCNAALAVLSAPCAVEMRKEATPSTSEKTALSEFKLCESCGAEFEDYIKISENKGKPHDIFWHNREWLQMWSLLGGVPAIPQSIQKVL